MVQEHLGPVFQTSFTQILSAPTPSEIFSKVCVFSASVNFKAFFIHISWSSLIYEKPQVIRWDIYYFSERIRCRLSKKVQTFNKFLLWNPRLLKMEFLCTLSQKNFNISAQGIRILDPRAVLKTSSNSTNNFRTRKWDLTTKYSSKKPWSWQTLENTIFRKFCEG